MVMSKRVNAVNECETRPGESIINGLREAIAWAEGDLTAARETTVPVSDTGRRRVGKRVVALPRKVNNQSSGKAGK